MSLLDLYQKTKQNGAQYLGIWLTLEYNPKDMLLLDINIIHTNKYATIQLP